MSIPPAPPIPPANAAHTVAGDRPEVMIHAEGQTLVTPMQASLPERCVVCNQPETKRLNKSFVWYPKRTKWKVALSDVSAIHEEIKTFKGRKRGHASFGLCAGHAARRRGLLLLVWSIPVAMIGVAVAGAVMASNRVIGKNDDMYFYVAAVIGCIADVIWAARVVPILKLRGFIRDEMRLSGAGQPFLASLSKPAQPLPATAIPRPNVPSPRRSPQNT